MNTLSVTGAHFKLWDKTDEWLSEILKESFSIDELKVIKTECVPLDCISGYLSQVFKLEVEYEQKLPGLPKSMILKCTHTNPFNRDLSSELKAFQGEIRFYSEMACRSEVKIPRCYYSYFNKETGDGFLLLEDLSSYPGGDQVGGVSLKDSMSVLKQIGKLHAQFWNSPDLYDFEDLPENEYVLAHDFRLGWQKFKAEKGHLLSNYQIEVGDLLQKKMQSVLFVAKYRPQSLIHSDLRADNLRYQPGKPSTMTILDWQLAAVGIPAFDFVRIVCGSRDNHYRDIEKLAYVWLKSLKSGGVKGYSIKSCIFDIKLALLIALHIPVVMHNRLQKMGSPNDNRTNSLAKIMIDRYFGCAEKFRVMSVLRQV